MHGSGTHMAVAPDSAGLLIADTTNWADAFLMSVAAAALVENGEMGRESGTDNSPDDLDVMLDVLKVSDCLTKDDDTKGEEEEFTASGQKWP